MRSPASNRNCSDVDDCKENVVQQHAEQKETMPHRLWVRSGNNLLTKQATHSQAPAQQLFTAQLQNRREFTLLVQSMDKQT